jgi:hypothetical protein
MQPGGQGITIGGTTISLQSPGTMVMIDPQGHTQTLAVPGGGVGGSPTTLAVGDQTLTLTSDPRGPGVIVAPGTTLHPGDKPVTVDGTVVSVGTSGIVLVDPAGHTESVLIIGTGTGASASATGTSALAYHGSASLRRLPNGWTILCTLIMIHGFLFPVAR